ncbi:MAG TPA: carbohydrate-binding domain-containing protein [Oligoflexus sp.]|uniref:carbohydrate-binding domain-containing protein n=1 Tax=Oligoflexus sp. TaxID=1971216 RepID=UPI002D3AE9E6|nr:carbohydrate-binding domain-containing protein [Oligoflexus sp.]HYX36916.1 carbohydrate-binding domain-containing protein [Oligoflexus sp.]
MKIAKKARFPSVRPTIFVAAFLGSIVIGCGQGQESDDQIVSEKESSAGLSQSPDMGLDEAGVAAQRANNFKVYHVSANGSDKNDGLSSTRPFKTIQKAANLTNPGDTVLIMNGTYTNPCYACDILEIERSGTASAWITYKAYPGHKPKLQLKDGWNAIDVLGASYFTIEGLEIEGNAASVSLEYARSQANNTNNPRTSGNCISVSKKKSGSSEVYPHHLIIRKNKVHHCGGGGIGVGLADYVTIEDNEVYSNAWWSVHANSGISLLYSLDIDNNRGYKNFIRRNKTYDNRMFIKWKSKNAITDGNGIIIDYNSNKPIKKPAYKGRTLVENNLTYLNGGSGIHAFNSSHVDIINNTSYMNGVSEELQGEIYSNGSDDVKILNNIMYARTGEEVNHKWGSTNLVNDYNIYYNTTKIPVKGPNDIVADPLFVDAKKRDFRLRAGSPAIDSGTSAIFAAVDLNGAGRAGPSVDRGAYEQQENPVVLTTLEAETLVPSSGALHWDGHAWIFYTNGTLETAVNFPSSGTYVFDVVAAGRSAADVAPILEVKVDGVRVGSVNVTDRNFSTYSLNVPITAGSRNVSISFVNDHYDSAKAQDRNVFIDKVTIRR